MATLISIQGQIELSMRLIRKTLDPFQQDLEWFEYDLSINLRRQAESPTVERHAVRGKLNKKDLALLLRKLDELLASNEPLRFEPYDLNFYFEWSRETPSVFLIITWFDLGLLPRQLDQRFPSAHTGFRFIAEESAISGFRRGLEEEFVPWSEPVEGISNDFVN